MISAFKSSSSSHHHAASIISSGSSRSMDELGHPSTYVYFDSETSNLRNDTFSDGILRCKGCNYILSAEHVTACRYCMGDLITKNKKLRGTLNELEEEVNNLKRDLTFLRAWDEDLTNSTSGTGDVTLGTRDGSFFKAHHFVLVIKLQFPVFSSNFIILSCFQASKSSVFKKRLEERDPKGVLMVDDMIPEIVGVFLEYLYTAQVSARVLEKHCSELLAAAHLYSIAPLKSVCEGFICRQVNRENAISMVELASKFDAVRIREAAYDAVTMTYKDILACPNFKGLLEREPRIAADMLREILLRTSP